MTSKEKIAANKVFLKHLYEVESAEKNLTLDKVAERAMEDKPWCPLYLEIAFMANELASLRSEVKRLKKKDKTDE